MLQTGSVNRKVAALAVTTADTAREMGMPDNRQNHQMDLKMFFRLKFPRLMGTSEVPNFDIFDPQVGVDGYCSAIRKYLFPNSNPFSFSLAAFSFESRTYCKGAVFSRVRGLSPERAKKFLTGSVSVSDFFPPTTETGKVSVGRFNEEGERKLYLADHPYVALKERGIEPGEYFLFSYFALKSDTHFVYADPDGSDFSRILYSLFKSSDERFYGVIRRVYNEYLSYDSHHGIAYDSVKVNKKQFDTTWGEIKSVTNLAMDEKGFPAAYLRAGWLARCDENYHPQFLKMFVPVASRKNRLTALAFNGNESKFESEYDKLNKEIAQMNEEMKARIRRNDFDEVNLNPVKMLPWREVP